METREYHFVDKSTWGPGAWHKEPDKKQWLDSNTGFPCLIVRNGHGALCGYVGVTKEHPYFKRDYGYYDDCPDDHLTAHGGLTYSSLCDKREGEHHVCHVVEKGEDDCVWWFGFDCSHYGDGLPKTSSYETFSFSGDDVYRDFRYVTKEIEYLAKQLKEIASE